MLYYFIKKCRAWALLAALLAVPAVSGAQVKLSPDTLECHIVGFSFGLVTPLAGSSTGLPGGTMKELYGGFYSDYNINWAYKFKSGWMTTFDAGMWFGVDGNSNNLLRRDERMGNVFNSQETAMGWNGTDGSVGAYNRCITAQPGVAYIVRLISDNPNSGLLLKLSGGWMMQKTVFSQGYSQSAVHQLDADYARLYDHLRNGVMLTESIGFIYMSNYHTYLNLKVSFELSQCWSWSSRPYQIDNLMGLNGKDHGRYFDLIGGIKLSWMFPFTGKTDYDYYYY